MTPITDPQDAAASWPMLAILLNVLTPVLAAGGLNDPAQARLAVEQAFARACPRNEAELFAVAQTVGYGYAGLEMLRASAGTDARTMTDMRVAALRLAGTAARAERSLALLRRQGDTPPNWQPDTAESAAEAAAQEAAVLAELQAVTAQLDAARAAVSAAPSSDRQSARYTGRGASRHAVEGTAPAQAANTGTGAARRPAAVDGMAPTQAHPGVTSTRASHRPTAGAGEQMMPAQPAPTTSAQKRPSPAGTVPQPGPAPAPSLMALFERDLIWGSAMTQVAQECAAALPGLSPDKRRQERIRIRALSSVARDLTSKAQGRFSLMQTPVPPGPA